MKNISPEIELNIQRFLLEKQKIVSTCLLGEGISGRSELSLMRQMEIGTENLSLELAHYILSQKLNKVVHPEDWLQAFKERWFPEWLKKRYPVRYAVYDVTAFYPKLHIKDDSNTYVIFNRIDKVGSVDNGR